jgi:hypothetical protein
MIQIRPIHSKEVGMIRNIEGRRQTCFLGALRRTPECIPSRSTHIYVGLVLTSDINCSCLFHKKERSTKKGKGKRKTVHMHYKIHDSKGGGVLDVLPIPSLSNLETKKGGERVVHSRGVSTRGSSIVT